MSKATSHLKEPGNRFSKQNAAAIAAALYAPSFSTVLLTLAISTIPAEVAAAGMFKLPVAFGADADHV